MPDTNGTTNNPERAALNNPVAARPVAAAPLDEAAPAPAVREEERAANLDMILDIPVNLQVELGRTSLPIQDLLKLGAGSVIELNRLAGQPADLVANGKRIGQGDIVVVDDHLGIRITKLVGPESRIQAL